jgi:hypothetical protein
MSLTVLKHLKLLCGNIGASRDLANQTIGFNVSEYGIDLKLNVPRIFMPFSTEKLLRKT